jgi:peptidoglycan/xylan/chitin deacetylase (PgdA/CDA1 family)
MEKRKIAIDEVKTLLKGFEDSKRILMLDKIENDLGLKLTFNSNAPAIHRPLTWAQIKEMIDSGLVTTGSHTCSHPVLTQCSSGQLEQELLTSKNIIESKSGLPCDLFCYPYGGNGSFNEQTTKMLKKTGYKCALTTIAGKNDQRSDLLTLKRMGTSNLVGMDNFTSSLSTSYKTLRRFKL